jgi:hypothetical protein
VTTIICFLLHNTLASTVLGRAAPGAALNTGISSILS